MEPVWEAHLQSLRGDLILYKEALKETASDLMQEGYSQFPVFVAHQVPVELGEPLFDHNELGTNWTIRVSYLEEFIECGLILKERQKLFQENYKDPLHYACMFVISPEGGRFVFIPYDISKHQNEAT